VFRDKNGAMKKEKVVDRSGMVPQTRADSRRKCLIPRLSALIRALFKKLKLPIESEI
jgi:hypothetical protein